MENSEKLKKLVHDNDYNIIQYNGQRVFAHSTMSYKVPPRGCELFVGRLPRDAMEDELVPLFMQIAPIYELRLMVNFMGDSRGYCFVRYFNRGAAETAIQRLNNYQLRPGMRIGVYWSLDNTRLFIGGLPMNHRQEEILSVLHTYMDGIKTLIMYPSHDRRYLNRGYAFLEFENHRAAAIARRQIPIGTVIWDEHIKIDWADPLPEPDPVIMSKVATLYMRNIPMSLSNADLQRELYKHIMPSKITRVHKMYDYAFVHFINHITATLGLSILRGFTIGKQIIEVTWARPQIYSRKYTKNTTPNHYCLSLPARARWQIKKKCAEKRMVQNSSDQNRLDPAISHCVHHQFIEPNDLLSVPSSSTYAGTSNFFDY